MNKLIGTLTNRFVHTKSIKYRYDCLIGISFSFVQHLDVATSIPRCGYTIVLLQVHCYVVCTHEFVHFIAILLGKSKVCDGDRR
jgi:hypothetical protein